MFFVPPSWKPPYELSKNLRGRSLLTLGITTWRQYSNGPSDPHVCRVHPSCVYVWHGSGIPEIGGKGNWKRRQTKDVLAPSLKPRGSRRKGFIWQCSSKLCPPLGFHFTNTTVTHPLIQLNIKYQLELHSKGYMLNKSFVIIKFTMSQC